MTATSTTPHPSTTDLASGLRAFMRGTVSTVSVIGAASGGAEGVPVYDALVVNSLQSVSLEPPLASVLLRTDSGFLGLLRESGRFAASVLTCDDAELVAAFSRPFGARPDLDPRRWRVDTVTGCPVLHRTAGVVECRIVQHIEVGDHTLVLGEVVAVAASEHAPLGWYAGRPLPQRPPEN